MKAFWKYKRLFGSVYAVIVNSARLGVVFPYGSQWCCVFHRSGKHFIGNTRDTAVSPGLVYRSYLEYESKLPPKAE